MAAISNTSIVGVAGSYKTRKFAFWGAYAVFLVASIPNVAWFISAYSDGSLFALVSAYLCAIVVEGAIYATALAIYAFLKWPNTVLKWFSIVAFLVINITCTLYSFSANWAHAVHFENKAMLSGTESLPIAFMLPVLAAAWPLFGVVFSVASRVITESKPADPFEGMTAEQIERWYEAESAKVIAQGNVKQLRSSIRGQSVGLQVGSALNTFRGAVNGTKVGVTNNYTPPQLLPAKLDHQNSVVPFPKQHSVQVSEVLPSPDMPDQSFVPQSDLKPLRKEDKEISVLPEQKPLAAAPEVTPVAEKPVQQKVKIAIVEAKDVNYEKYVGKATVKGFTFTRLDLAFRDFPHDPFGQGDLDRVFSDRLIDPKYLRYVQASKMIRIRVILDRPEICTLALAALGKVK